MALIDFTLSNARRFYSSIGNPLGWKGLTTWKAKNYRKRPCISCTFFQKIEAKNRGCGLSMDTSMFGVLKNLLNIHKTCKGAEKET